MPEFSIAALLPTCPQSNLRRGGEPSTSSIANLFDSDNLVG